VNINQISMFPEIQPVEIYPNWLKKAY